MAMEVTHIRFAKSLAERIGVQDFDAYYSGAIYPDSRYFTGVERDLTHHIDIPRLELWESLTDFQKGWSTHLYYDHHQAKKLRAWLGLTPDTRLRPYWYQITAAKLIEDMDSCRKDKELFETMYGLQVQELPRKEDAKKMEEYYKIQNHLYASGKVDMSNYEFLFSAFGEVDKDKLLKEALSIESNEKDLKFIQGFFQEIHASAIEFLENPS